MQNKRARRRARGLNNEKKLISSLFPAFEGWGFYIKRGKRVLVFQKDFFYPFPLNVSLGLFNAL